MLFSLNLTSCIPTLVKVNANTYRFQPIDKNKSFCVFRLRNTNTDIALEEDLARKVEKLLKAKGFQVVNDCKEADYIVAFQFGIDANKINYTLYIPQIVQKSESGYLSGNSYNYYLGNTDYNGNYYTTKQELVYLPVNTTETIYTRSISVFVIDANSSKRNGKIELVWQGNFASSGKSGDFRRVADYILVAVNKLFGKDTHGIVNLEVWEDEQEYQQLKKILYEDTKKMP